MCLAFRIDDIGASSKEYEVYSNKALGLGNILFLKYLHWFRAWGPYREMTPDEWVSVFETLERYGARLTVAITATWVEFTGERIPFPKKFPDQAKIIKKGIQAGLIEVANHGLTHCVTEKMRFRPRSFSSNRKYHREFWDWLPEQDHFEHLKLSQEILQAYFETEIITFVPPGNVFSDTTIRACAESGIKIINCNTSGQERMGLRIIGNEQVFDFHDREIVLSGIAWLEDRLRCMPEQTEFTFIRDL